MRGLRTPVSDLRKSIFTEVAKIAYEADSANLNDAVEAVPYTVWVCLYGHRINRYMLPVASKRAMWQKNIMSHLLCR